MLKTMERFRLRKTGPRGVGLPACRALPGVLLSAALISLALLGPFTAGPAFTPAFAQAAASPEVQSLLDRVERLRRDMDTLQRQVYRGGGAPAPAPGGAAPMAIEPSFAADMQVRLDEIEAQMRGFTGRLEEAHHEIGELRKMVETLTSDIDLRLQALEGRGGTAGQPGGPAAPGPTQPNTAEAAPSQEGVLGSLALGDLEKQGAAQPGQPPQGQEQSAALPEGTPDEQYRFATSFLAKSDYAGAARALEAFIAAHPEHRLAGNAQYWLGETHYVRGDYNNAALAFAKGYKDYPKSQKGPDNLLKLGLSLVNLKKIDSACVTFDRLGKDFPEAPQDIKARAAAERKKLNCR